MHRSRDLIGIVNCDLSQTEREVGEQHSAILQTPSDREVGTTSTTHQDLNLHQQDDISQSSHTSSSIHGDRKPDADSMKMFVGQIPRDWNEDDCIKLLEPFGEIFALNMLRDKETKKSKGCCFVTYFTRKAALDAQNALHNLKKLPSCRNPIQMKPADNENKNERKLFVGKLSKSLKEQDVMQTFGTYGTIEECVVLRDANGQSKGCAFVTYSSRSSAFNAIRALHQTKPFEGSTTPIVVKFAESNDKKPKNGSTSPIQIHSLYSTNPPVVPSYMPNASAMLDNSYIATLLKAQQPQQLVSFPFSQQYLTASEMATYSGLMFGGGKLPTLLPGQLINSATSSSALETAAKFMSAEQLTLATLPSLASVPSAYPLMPKLTSPSHSKQTEGPDGANLFIYHLPAEYTDADLVNIFSSFGNVISAKVYIDKNSNLSKCFGFVSYDNPDAAQAAIRAMNGFQIMNKRLKVQLKKRLAGPLPASQVTSTTGQPVYWRIAALHEAASNSTKWTLVTFGHFISDANCGHGHCAGCTISAALLFLCVLLYILWRYCVECGVDG